MVEPRQGDIWWATVDKRRPVLVITRSEVAGLLNRIVVAPVTRTVRDIPTEIPLGAGEGLQSECAATFDNLSVVLRRELTEKAGQLGDDGQDRICVALRALADC